MRLSDAIRKGCTIFPGQIRLYFFDAESESACVIGAGFVGIGGDAVNNHAVEWEMLRVFPILERRPVACPAGTDCSDPEAYLLHILYHLNDTHCWTREAIADWVETLEMGEAHEAQPLPALEPATATA